LDAVNDICKDKAGLNIEKLKPIQIVRKLKTPAIFITGKDDKVIPCN